MQTLRDLLSRWTYTDRESEMIGDLFRRVPAAKVRRTVDYILASYKDFERPTFRQIGLHIEQGVPSVDGPEFRGRTRSTITPDTAGPDLPEAEKGLFWQWAIGLMTDNPSVRARVTKRYMDESDKAGHHWSATFRACVFGHWERNDALAKVAVKRQPNAAHADI